MNDSQLLSELQTLRESHKALSDYEERRKWMAKAAALVEQVNGPGAEEIRRRAQVLAMPLSTYTKGPAWGQALQIVEDVVAKLESGGYSFGTRGGSAAVEQTGLSSENKRAPAAANEEDDLSKKSLKVLIAMLKPGQAWSVLTILVGLLVGAFSLGKWTESWSDKPSPTPAPHWLIIEGVEIAPSHTAQLEVVRVMVSVNGEDYISYPAGHVWAEIRPGMPKERYPLIGRPENYSLRFGAFLSGRGPAPTIEARCQGAEIVAVGTLPATSRRCDLFPSANSYWEGSKIGSVTYSVM